MTMRLWIATTILVLAAPTVWAAEATDLAAAAHDCLRKADFDGAVKSFTAAAKADPANDDYLLQVKILRRVLQLRDRLAKTENKEDWLQLSTSLRAFYVDNLIYSEALPLDQRTHELQHTSASAATLARTQLALGQNQEAEALLSGLPAEQTSSETRLLLAIAQGRQGQLEAAKAVVAQPASKEATPDESLDRARLLALLGDQSAALESVKLALECTPPVRIEFTRDTIRTCADFGKLSGNEAFASALKTESKIKVSECSSGSSCGSCPSRSSCGSKSSSKDAAGCAGEKK